MDNELVGKKCANLGEMTRMGLPVPPGFALSVEAYSKFLSETSAKEEIRQYLGKFGKESLNIEQLQVFSKALRQIVESKEISNAMAKAIISYYDELSRRCNTSDVAVSARSAGPVSHPGQYETYLDIKGASDLLGKIVKVWASSFNPRSLAF
jgi:pyruvate,water dikinase